LSTIGVIDARKAGELTVYVGFAWLGAAVIIDLLTRKRDALKKANGRIVAAALALVVGLTSAFNSYQGDKKVDAAKTELIEQFMATTVQARNEPAPATSQPEAPPPAVGAPAEATPPTKPFIANEADRMVSFLNAMKVRAKEFAEQSTALDRKFNSTDMSAVLVPQTLTRKDGIQTSRKTLDRYKGLVQERNSMLKQHFIQTEQVIRNQGLTEREINEALAGMRGPQNESVKAYADLSAAQLLSLKATGDILDFAERSLGRVVVQNGQMMFQTQPELDEYNRLMQVLTAVAANEEVVTQRVTVLSQKSKQHLVDQLK
jgi:hypothetical protein